MNLSHINKKRPLIIRSNFGDESIALTQWVFEAKLKATVVYVDTGFAASSWEARIALGQVHAKNCGFPFERIVSKISFEEAVLGRDSFPSVKFQWCTGLLKGLPFLDWLELNDSNAEAMILIAKRRAAALNHEHLPEWIERCEFHNDRTVWHPMIDVSDEDRNALLKRAGFIPLGHRSLECQPCVNSSKADCQRLNSPESKKDKHRLENLQKEIGIVWIPETEYNSESKEAVVQSENENNKNKAQEFKFLDLFYRSCGNHFGCGL